jgi:hypothetical protein
VQRRHDYLHESKKTKNLSSDISMTEHETHSTMRACTKWAFEHGVEGSPRDQEWQKMRHAIIFECKRIGIDRAETKQMILAWNSRNLSPLSPSDANRQLCGFVDRLYKENNAKLSCKALQDYCVSDDSFCFLQRKRKSHHFHIPWLMHPVF